jgi:DNA-binding MarR family transcriptional regulator
VDPADRRRLLIHASERGSDLERTLRQPLQQAETAALTKLSPGEIQTLRTLLERLG